MNIFAPRTPSDYLIKFQTQEYLFDSVSWSHYQIKPFDTVFSFKTVSIPTDFLETLSTNTPTSVVEIQEVRDYDGNRKILKIFYSIKELTVSETVQSDGEDIGYIVSGVASRVKSSIT